jgi:predicted transcriptional regulator
VAGAERRAPGALESEVMSALWAADQPMSPADVQRALRGGLAYNTVQTILIRLVDKGVAQRRAAGRGHVYWPTLDEAAAAAQQMRAALTGRPHRAAILQQFAAALDDADARTLRRLLSRQTGEPS